MNLKARLALLSATGLLSVSALAGYGTYAMFTAQSSNSNNTFTSGTLNITPERDDVPNTGPMFYTSSTSASVGGLATGLWAPGDVHTRGLFLENTGTLSALLSSISATPADSAGNPVTSSSTGSDASAYNDDMLFAKQASVIVWQVQAYDISGGTVPLTSLTANEMDYDMNTINTGYQLWLNEHSGRTLDSQTDHAQVLDFVNQYMFSQMNSLSGSNVYFKVVQMYTDTLNDFVNNSPINEGAFDVSINPTNVNSTNNAALLAFTVGMDTNPPAGSGVDPNSMQGKSVYFNFGTNWVQSRHADSFASQDWTASGPGTSSVTYPENDPNSVVFNYDGTPSMGGQWRYTNSAKANKSETIDFNYDYSGNHSWYDANAYAEAFVDGPNGQTIVPLWSGGTYGQFDHTGSSSIQVNQGYSYGFIVGGSNFDSSEILQGQLEVTRTN